MAAWNLAGTQLPAPASYDIEIEYRGAVATMADGSQQTDLVNANAKRLWTLTFDNLDSTDRATVETAYGATVAAASSTFYDEGNTSRTVTNNALDTVKWSVIKAASGYRFSGSIKLREV